MNTEIKTISPFRNDVSELIDQANEYMSALYPAESNHFDDPAVLSKPNVCFLGLFNENRLIGIGAVKILTDDSTYGEIKRMYLLPEFRGNGLSKLIMNSLEEHLVNQEVKLARLETGISQPEAIGLYEKMGYKKREPFGAYKIDPLSIFMEKELC